MWRQHLASAATRPPLSPTRSRIAISSSPLWRQCSPGTATATATTPRSLSSTARRRVTHSSGPFEPLRPPSPASLGAPRAARSFRRTRRWTRRLLVLSALLGAGYLLDHELYASGIARSLRTFGTGLLVAADYKLNFRAEPLPVIGSQGGIRELHRRSAERLFELLRHNGGLYLKIGRMLNSCCFFPLAGCFMLPRHSPCSRCSDAPDVPC